MAALVLAAAGTATPAMAQSQALLDCAVGTLDSSYRAAIGDAAMRGALDGVTGRLENAVTACAGRYDLTVGQQAAYYQYSLTRTERDEFARRLTSAGIPTSVIDDALDFGAGRSNPLYEGKLPDDAVNAMYGALKQSGVNVGAVADGTWGLIGVYMQSSSTMWNAREKLP